MKKSVCILLTLVVGCMSPLPEDSNYRAFDNDEAVIAESAFYRVESQPSTWTPYGQEGKWIYYRSNKPVMAGGGVFGWGSYNDGTLMISTVGKPPRLWANGLAVPVISGCGVCPTF